MNYKGSITIEATIMLPLFLAIISLFLFFFQVLFIQTRMERVIDSVGRKCSVYGYALEEQQEVIQDVITVLYVRNEVLKQYGEEERLYKWIKNGKKGISFLGSGIAEGGTVLKLVVTYEIKVPFLSGFSIKCIQSSWKRLWTGEAYEEIVEDYEDEDKQYVYVTRNGSVYHTNLQCSYLKRTIISVSDIEDYEACELCCKDSEKNAIYYVTTKGNHYHITLECSSLVRYIEKRLFSEVEHLKKCIKCAQA